MVYSLIPVLKHGPLSIEMTKAILKAKVSKKVKILLWVFVQRKINARGSASKEMAELL